MIVGQLHAKDYDVTPEVLKFSMDDQSNVFDIHQLTGILPFRLDLRYLQF